HGDRHVHPRPAGNQVGAEHHAAVRLAAGALRAHDLGEHQARRVAVAVVEAHRLAERLAMRAVHDLEPAAAFQQVGQLRDEAGAVARVRVARALPAGGADHVGRVREQQPRRFALLPRRQQSAGVVEVQVREHHHVDVLVAEARLAQRFEQHVPVFLYAVALAQLRLEERADAGLEQHRLPGQRRRQQRAARQLDPVELVRRRPAFPQRARRVAEHRAAVELLRVAEDGPELHGPILAFPAQGGSATSPLPTGLRGSAPADSSLRRRSHATVLRMPQVPSSGFTLCPIASSAATVSGSSAPSSPEITSGHHWWWNRGLAATSCADRPSSYPRMPSRTSVMMRLPPGAPSAVTLSGENMEVGVIELSMRLPGSTALASKPITPNALGVPGFSAKSSISSLRITPVPGGTRPDPYSRLIVCVAETMLPSASMIEKCVVSSSSSGAGWPGSSSLGVAFSGWMVARRPAAYSGLSRRCIGMRVKSGSPR